MTLCFPHTALQRLANRVTSGEVVFFVGAGFSLDSERNSTWRLIARLMARFDAMTACLAVETGSSRSERELGPWIDPGVRAQAKTVRETLCELFPVEASKSHGQLLTQDNVTALSKSYYAINDWICGAFTVLLGLTEEISMLEGHCALVREIGILENRLLEKEADDEVPLEPLELDALLGLATAARGKALFLDTMGFDDERIMAGSTVLEDPDEVIGRYGDRLLPRHRVVASLAREGLCPTLLTTNYDLLLEGAYRLAGFDFERQDEEGSHDRLPAVRQRFCNRIGEATQFFSQTDGHCSALIAKIHGCVECYRRAKADEGVWEAYLPSMVFTYREIQNWREDSWSRDLVRTLLRTRTIVFTGYSAADPVLHDTFRTVYEEMADRRHGLPEAEPFVTGGADGDEGDAPAFFLGTDRQKEFHGLEILRAASRSSRVEPRLTDHDNYLRFFLPAGSHRKFPSLDELFLWIQHLVVREIQARSLEVGLRRVLAAIRGRPGRGSEVTRIVTDFMGLRGAELDRARQWDESSTSRREFERIVGWTRHFHPGLLRERAIAEALRHRSGRWSRMGAVRDAHWVFPFSENPDWTAWGALLEIALRKAALALRGGAGNWAGPSPTLETGRGAIPRIYAATDAGSTPICVELRTPLPGSHHHGKHPPGWIRSGVVWPIQADFALGASPGAGPDPGTLLSWALGHVEPETLAATFGHVQREAAHAS